MHQTDPATIYIRSAIAMLEGEKIQLISQGVRPGAIVAGKNGAGRDQHHWVVSAKQRQYVPKKLLAEYQAEVDRQRLVDAIDRRLGLLEQAIA
jgi:hypothetical protein